MAPPFVTPLGEDDRWPLIWWQPYPTHLSHVEEEEREEGSCAPTDSFSEYPLVSSTVVSLADQMRVVEQICSEYFIPEDVVAAIKGIIKRQGVWINTEREAYFLVNSYIGIKASLSVNYPQNVAHLAAKLAITVGDFQEVANKARMIAGEYSRIHSELLSRGVEGDTAHLAALRECEKGRYSLDSAVRWVGKKQSGSGGGTSGGSAPAGARNIAGPQDSVVEKSPSVRGRGQLWRALFMDRLPGVKGSPSGVTLYSFGGFAPPVDGLGDLSAHPSPLTIPATEEAVRTYFPENLTLGAKTTRFSGNFFSMALSMVVAPVVALGTTRALGIDPRQDAIGYDLTVGATSVASLHVGNSVLGGIFETAMSASGGFYPVIADGEIVLYESFAQASLRNIGRCLFYIKGLPQGFVLGSFAASVGRDFAGVVTDNPIAQTISGAAASVSTFVVFGLEGANLGRILSGPQAAVLLSVGALYYGTNWYDEHQRTEGFSEEEKTLREKAEDALAWKPTFIPLLFFVSPVASAIHSAKTMYQNITENRWELTLARAAMTVTNLYPFNRDHVRNFSNLAEEIIQAKEDEIEGVSRHFH